MIIVGAKGFAKEVLEIFYQRNELDQLFFFDDLSEDSPAKLFDRFPILKNINEVKNMFDKTGDTRFTLGLGNPVFRYQLCQLFTNAGGILTSTISPKADIGNFGTKVSDGCNILSGTVITNGVHIGKGCLINPCCTISHDSFIGDFVQLSPGVCLTGHSRIGDFCILGTNSVILPKVNIGTNVMVGAGSIVTKDIPDNSVVMGIPGVIKKTIEPLRLNKFR